MKQRLITRLKTLESELSKGQEMLAKLDQERVSLTNNMLRISGAIQVLKEELAEEEKNSEGLHSTTGEETSV